MYEHVRHFSQVDYTAEKPCEMDETTVHTLHAVRRVGDDGDIELTAKIMRDIRKMSDGRQLVLGTTIGFLSSYVLTKTGKYVCIIAGASVIILQLAGQHDYIKFNILRSLSNIEVNRVPNESRRRALRPTLANFVRKLYVFLVEQPNLSSGIIGGFLIGLGFS